MLSHPSTLSSTLQDNTWQEILQPLHDGDLIGLILFDDSNKIGIDGDGPDDGVSGKRVLYGDGWKTLTWIWTVGSSRKKVGVDSTKADLFVKETSTGECMPIDYICPCTDSILNSSLCQVLSCPSTCSPLAGGMSSPGQGTGPSGAVLGLGCRQMDRPSCAV